MKHLFSAVIAFILIVAALCGIMSLTSCRGESPQEKQKEFAKQYELYANPEFSSFEEALDYQAADIKQFREDSVFRCIPEESLEKVIIVLQNTGAKLSKSTIAEQYLEGKKIFDNIEPKIEHKQVQEEIDSIASLQLTTTSKDEQGARCALLWRRIERGTNCTDCSDYFSNGQRRRQR